ncbi:MAG TPA: DMT family transporter [Flavitalea sp.]|nr:DMT family transporter [Flavitalea sp.]
MKKAFLQLHAAVFLAGFTGILGRLISLNEAVLVWYRLLISAVTLWIIFYFQKKLKKVSFRDMALITGTGFVLALHWVTFYGSIRFANVSVAVVCFSAIGFFTALIEPLILQKKIQWVECLLGLLSIAGIAIIFHFDPQYKYGIIIGLLSALLGCLFPIFNRQFVQRIAIESVTLYELSGGFIFLTFILPFYLKISPAASLIPSASDSVWLLLLSWICTVLAFHLSMNALTRISAFTVNLTYLLEPLYTILLAFLLFRENKQLGPAFYAGLGLITLSVLLQTFLVYKLRKSA